MTASGYLRGNTIHWDQDRNGFVYDDTRELTVDTWHDRPCGYCGLSFIIDADPCLYGLIPGAKNACCGHGIPKEAYIQYSTVTVRGTLARGLQERDDTYRKNRNQNDTKKTT